MVPADRCNGFPPKFTPSTNMGILRYNGSSEADPTTQRQKYPTACSDEPYSSLVPIVPWKVEAPSNERKSNKAVHDKLEFYGTKSHE